MARPSRQDNCRIAIHGGRKKPMSCSDDQPTGADALDTLDDAVAAAAFRRLVRLLQHRHDAANIDLMSLAGFCRNCLGDWIAEAGGLATPRRAACRERGCQVVEYSGVAV